MHIRPILSKNTLSIFSPMRRLLKATYAAASAAEARQSLALVCAAADASESDGGTQQLGKRLFLDTIIARFLPSPTPGVVPLVLRLNDPISCAAEGPSGLTIAPAWTAQKTVRFLVSRGTCHLYASPSVRNGM